MKKHAAPILAAILLLLPVLYVGSYAALVVPSGTIAQRGVPEPGQPGVFSSEVYLSHYRQYGRRWSERVFWPWSRSTGR
jgi:hypothetical protein